MMRIDASWSVSPQAPNIIAPRHRGETLTPVPPSARNSMSQAYRLAVRGRGEEPRMRQLTGLDAQFLALESPRQSGHVGGVAVLDPSTRPNGSLELGDVQQMIAERLPLLPPFRWRLRAVP